MSTATPSDIRQLFIQTLKRWGVAALPEDVSETVRLDRGKVVARTYRCERFMAMWFVEFGLVQFYDDNGSMIAAFDAVDEPAERQTRAA